MAIELTDEEYELLNFFEQVWLESGLLITREKAVLDYGIPAETFDACWKSPKFRAALDERGVSLKTAQATERWRLRALTEVQLTAANVMLDFHDTRSQKKKLSDLGLSTAQWQSWLRDKAFQDYLRQRAENILGDNTHEAHLALVDRVRSGDLGAIKYYNEITGRYVAAADSNVNVQLVMLRVLEIIQKYVTDVRVQDAIANEFLSLSQPAAANAVVQLSPVEVPELLASVGVTEEPLIADEEM